MACRLRLLARVHARNDIGNTTFAATRFMFVGCGSSGGSAALRAAACATVALGRRAGLTNLGPLTPFLLPLGSLPTAQQSQALRMLAIALIPTPGLKAPAASPAQAGAVAKTPNPSPQGLAVGMLGVSQGR